ncbi:hypothetical protein Cfla_0573 [Cellulomonas flavigena DSM 20109]|uniref:Uncharacterized protein n=1 Tax=Cellulomonas flavigena (strain ATCC 482 / DSM 20109 / BCRC 11376 / JCM 18109 / NBRC 3775 / NCIMB 8073 / NRS 134) TaxID=446466 RepID=D5UII6_CELFN|nr:hypothetical protein Cfla_0573 [Cellulomonas flavigena DSM 20109]
MPPVRHDGRVRRDVVRPPWGAACALVASALLLTGCTSGPEPVQPVPTAAPAPSATGGTTFTQAVAALTPDLVPAGQVTPCEELEPGSPEAREHLERATAAATAEPAPTPTLPSCGLAAVEALRAASIAGLAFAAGVELELPVAGGAARAVEVYQLQDAAAAAVSYAEQVTDEEGWAQDQEVPAQDLGDGTVQPRTVVSGARTEVVEVPGWTATVFARDEVSYASDGEQVADPVSYAYLWAVRDDVLVRVHVAGDVPGAAAATAVETARTFAAGVAAAG